MARKKVKLENIPQTWEEADKLLGEMAARQREVDRIQIDLEGRIDGLKQQAKEAAKDHQAAIAEAEKRLGLFADAHKADFGKQKSRELTSGVIGWRQSTVTKLLHGAAETVRRLMAMGLAQCVRQKEPEVDKMALRGLSTEQQEMAGVSITSKDTFFWEPATQEVPTTEVRT